MDAVLRMREPERRMRGGGGGAHLAGIVYDVELTLGAPARGDGRHGAERAGAHACEALYVVGRERQADENALAGARAIARRCRASLDDAPSSRGRRACSRVPLTPARRSGAPASRSGTRWRRRSAAVRTPHGAMNAICLPPALRFNEQVAEDALARLAYAMGAVDAAVGPRTLLACAASSVCATSASPSLSLPTSPRRSSSGPGAKANPRPASAAEVADLFRSIY